MFFLVTVLVTLVLNDIECSVVRRFHYDARLYEHFQFDSRYIHYARTKPEAWKDIPSLIKSRNFTYHSMICTKGPGAWLFYPGANYTMSNSHMYYLVVGEHCVRSDDVNSIQPLGVMHQRLEQGVILFGKSEFGTSPINTTNTTEGEESGGDVGSIIFTGPTPFLIEGGGKKICLKPSSTLFDRGYCLFPNINSSLGIHGPIKVMENCTDSEGGEVGGVTKVIVENCYSDGVYEQYTDQDLTIETLNKVCVDEGDDYSNNKFYALMDMWEKRTDLAVIAPPGDINEAEKIDLLWKILDVFQNTCPTVNRQYIFLMGHLFVNHLRQVWNKEKEEGTSNKDGQVEEDHLKFSKRIFDYCLDHNDILATFEPDCGTWTTEYGYIEEYSQRFGHNVNDSAWFEIVNGHNFDAAIEQIWLMGSTAIAVCNKASNFINNNWADIVYVFHRYFLGPVKDQWAQPGDWTKVYQSVLYGFDFRREHRNIVFCLEGALKNSLQFDPIGRPRSFSDFLLYRYSIPAHGKVHKTM